MKIQRNAACPCGSGKKYKQCCLNKEQSTSITQKLFLSLRSDGTAGDGQRRVWSEEHQHWHTEP